MIPNDAHLNDVLRTALAELLAAYGAPALAPSPARAGARRAQIAGVIGFTGSLRGALVIASSEALFRTTSPIECGNIDDWTAELANQLLGRFKNKLLASSVQIHLATPITVHGRDLTCAPGARCAVAEVIAAGCLVHAHVDFASEPRLGGVATPISAMPEGAVGFFLDEGDVQ